MRAVTITEDRSLEWAERRDPVPGDHDLLVAVGAAGLNGADLLQKAGFYPPPAGIPADIPGLEFAGEVLAVGIHTTGFKIGDRVMALVGGAAQAELAITDEKTAIHVPEDMDLQAAGGFMEAAATAYDALFTQAQLSAGETLLVTGAAGGVGSIGVQLGAAAGATVVASTRNPEFHSTLIELGAAAAVTPAESKEFGPFDVVLELVGGDGTADSVSALATLGRVVVIGIGAGSKFELDLRLLMSKRGRIFSSTMRFRPLAERAVVVANVAKRVIPFVESGALIVPIAASYPMPDASHAYDRFASGAKMGKVMLVDAGTSVALEDAEAET